MNSDEIEQLTRQVASQVTDGRAIQPRQTERVPARELTIELQPEPYPEVEHAWQAFSRLTGTEGNMVSHQVRRDEEPQSPRARVSATLEFGARTVSVSGVGEDVVAASVSAFVTIMQPTA